jgi:hypothetical protein
MSAAWFHDTSGIMDLHVSQLMSARSFTFKESKKLDPKRESFPSIQAVQVCCPNYIKIDVPGLTQEIFAGATQTLANPALRQIQVKAREHKGGRRIAELLIPLGFKLMRPGMRCDGKLQSHLVLVRDILGTNDVAAPAPSASNQVGFRRGAAEPSR